MTALLIGMMIQFPIGEAKCALATIRLADLLTWLITSSRPAFTKLSAAPARPARELKHSFLCESSLRGVNEV
jgi:hypothetical protein